MRRRLALSFAAVTTTVVLAFVIPLAALVQRVAADRALNSAQQLAAAIAPVLAFVDEPDLRDGIVSSAAASNPGELSVILPDSTVIGAPAGVDDSVELARRGQAFTVDAPGGRAVLVPVVAAEGTTVIRVLVPTAALRDGVLRAWTLLGLLAAALIVVAVIVGDRLARALVRPIRDLAGVAVELSSGNLDARVTPTGPPEIVEVAHAQNRLASRIVALLAAEREAAADLSHRLRTPITALRLEADSLGDPAESARIAAGVDSLTRAVNRVIDDARRPSGTGAPAADLAEVARARVAFWGVLADEEHRTHRLEVPDGPALAGATADDLEAVLDALLGNVIAHTPVGTGFTVTVERGDDGQTRLVVDDDGPGLAEGAVRRGMSTGGSTGLGLDIVRRTAEASGGSLEIGRAPGGGARVAVTFGAAC